LKQSTPLKAIRSRCLDCAETRTEIRECPFDGKEDEYCPLHPYRMGKGRPKLKEIRAYCLWCCAGSKHEVRLCPVADCPLWGYRFGKRGQETDSEAGNHAL
jgi:hypothetical protein